MDVKCEILNYYDDPIENQKVVVQDAGCEGDLVIISIGETKVKVSSKEIIAAVERCTRCSYPYL